MANLVGVESQFSNLTTRSDVVGCVDSILEEELRQSTRCIGLAAR